MTETHGLSLTRLMGYTAVVMATLTVLLVLYRLGQVVLLFVLSIIVAAALRKGVIALEHRRVPRGVAILIWSLAIVGVLGLGIYLLGASLGGELQTIGETFPQRYDVLLNRYQQGSSSWQQAVAQRLPDTDMVIQSLGEGGAAEIGFQLAGLTSGLLSVVVSLGAVLGFSLYWLIEQDHFERLWLTLLPVQQRAIARHAWRGIEHQVGAYVRSEAAQFVLTITILWLAFRFLGVSYPTLYALFAGVVQLIPWVGIPLTLAPLALMTLSHPWWIIIATGVVIVVVGILMDQFVEPQLSGDAPVHPILTVLALMILGEASGVIGMLIALPLAATLQIVLRELVRVSASPRALALAAETTQLKELQARIDLLRHDMPSAQEERREAEGMLVRLQELVDRTSEVVREHAEATRSGRAVSGVGRRIPAIFQRSRTS